VTSPVAFEVMRESWSVSAGELVRVVERAEPVAVAAGVMVGARVFKVEGPAMELRAHVHGLEISSSTGQPVDRREVERRGLLVVGRRLLAERDEARKAGRAFRRLTAVELRALNTAAGEEHRA